MNGAAYLELLLSVHSTRLKHFDCLNVRVELLNLAIDNVAIVPVQRKSVSQQQVKFMYSIKRVRYSLEPSSRGEQALQMQVVYPKRSDMQGLLVVCVQPRTSLKHCRSTGKPTQTAPEEFTPGAVS